MREEAANQVFGWRLCVRSWPRRLALYLSIKSAGPSAQQEAGGGKLDEKSLLDLKSASVWLTLKSALNLLLRSD